MKLALSPFDTEFYARRIGRLIPEPGDDGSALASAVARARHERFDVLFLRVNDDDPLRAAVESTGVEAIDHLVVSVHDRSRQLPVVAPSGLVLTHHDRLELAEEIEAVETLTSTIRQSHLHADPRLPLEQTRALYAAWARNDVTGRGVRTILARSEGRIVGYLAVIETHEGLALDLAAVHDDQRGRGVGAAMFASGLEWAAKAETVTLGTQQTNRALSLYRRLGFVPREIHVMYHLWLAET